MGVGDTQCISEDHITEDGSKVKGSSLGSLVVQYSLHEKRLSTEGKTEFKGAHNGGNDAIANPQVLLAKLLDPLWDTDDYGDDDDIDNPFEMVDSKPISH